MVQRGVRVLVVLLAILVATPAFAQNRELEDLTKLKAFLDGAQQVYANARSKTTRQSFPQLAAEPTLKREAQRFLWRMLESPQARAAATSHNPHEYAWIDSVTPSGATNSNNPPQDGIFDVWQRVYSSFNNGITDERKRLALFREHMQAMSGWLDGFRTYNDDWKGATGREIVDAIEVQRARDPFDLSAAQNAANQDPASIESYRSKIDTAIMGVEAETTQKSGTAYRVRQGGKWAVYGEAIRQAKERFRPGRQLDSSIAGNRPNTFDPTGFLNKYFDTTARVVTAEAEGQPSSAATGEQADLGKIRRFLDLAHRKYLGAKGRNEPEPHKGGGADTTKRYAQQALWKILESEGNRTAAPGSRDFVAIDGAGIIADWKAVFPNASQGLTDQQLLDAFTTHMQSLSAAIEAYRPYESAWKDYAAVAVLDRVDDMRATDRFDPPQSLANAGQDPDSIDSYRNKIDAVLAEVEATVPKRIIRSGGYKIRPGAQLTVYRELIRQADLNFPKGHKFDVTNHPQEANVIGSELNQLDPSGFIKDYMVAGIPAIADNRLDDKDDPAKKGGGQEEDGDVAK